MMTNEKRVKECILEIVKNLLGKEHDRVELSKIGIEINKKGLDYKQMGYSKLQSFLEQYKDVLEIESEQNNDYPPILYVRIKDDQASETIEPEDVILSYGESEFDFLPDSLMDKVTLVEKNMKRLNEFITGSADHPKKEIIDQLSMDYENAKKKSEFCAL